MDDLDRQPFTWPKDDDDRKAKQRYPGGRMNQQAQALDGRLFGR
jgi:hypothetical protein